MPILTVTFESNVTSIRCDVFYGEDYGFISYRISDNSFTSEPPPGIPIDIWFRCIYRFFKIVGKILKPIETV